jgi:hypothetical protein
MLGIFNFFADAGEKKTADYFLGDVVPMLYQKSSLAVKARLLCG